MRQSLGPNSTAVCTVSMGGITESLLPFQCFFSLPLTHYAFGASQTRTGGILLLEISMLCAVCKDLVGSSGYIYIYAHQVLDAMRIVSCF